MKRLFNMCTIAALQIALLLLAGCNKNNTDPYGLNNTMWWPTYAEGSAVQNGHTLTWNGPVDESGSIIATYEEGGETFEYPITVKGIHFYQEGKENLYVLFVPGMPSKSKPMGYYIDDGKIYLEEKEYVSEDPTSSQVQIVRSGKYNSYVLEVFSTDALKFDGVTYKK